MLGRIVQGMMRTLGGPSLSRTISFPPSAILNVMNLYAFLRLSSMNFAPHSGLTATPDCAPAIFVKPCGEGKSRDKVRLQPLGPCGCNRRIDSMMAHRRTTSGAMRPSRPRLPQSLPSPFVSAWRLWMAGKAQNSSPKSSKSRGIYSRRPWLSTRRARRRTPPSSRTRVRSVSTDAQRKSGQRTALPNLAVNTGAELGRSLTIGHADSTTWCILGQDGRKVVKKATGTGGLDALTANWKDDEARLLPGRASVGYE